MNLRRKLIARLMATIAVGGLLTAGPVAVGAESASAAVGPDPSSGVQVDAGYLRVGMDTTGQVTSLVDRRTGQNHLVAGHGSAPLVSLVVGGKQVKPTALTRTGSVLAFTNSAAGTEVDVVVHDRASYTTFTVTKVKAPPTSDVQTLLWGPLATTLTERLGESAGLASNGGFTAGMKVLNDRTEGGWPRDYTGMGWQDEVDLNYSHLRVSDSDHPLEQWAVGGHTPWGNLLRAFTFDYTKQRLRMNDSGYRIPVGPLPSGGKIVGSEIALYGTTPDLVPTVLSTIAKNQNLPYPTINGQWQKTAQATSKSILVLSDLNTGNVGAADQFAKAAGIDMVYSLPGADGPWQSAGHYQFNSQFGSSDAAATTLVSTSTSNGVAVGAHTLSNFIDTNDPYIKPSPSPGLARGQSTKLTRPLASGDTTLSMASCDPLAAGLQGKRLLIDNEFLTYTGSSTVGGECQVTGLARGQWSSSTASHSTGATAYRVQMNQYGGGYGNLNIIDDVATRFATIWNTTGITATSFDGLESASDAGWGAYGMARMVNGSFTQLNAKDGFISETSREGSNVWDALSRASWGEVGSTSMSQVFTNNAYYQANYLPGMLGWIALPGSANLRTVEDNLARGAGLNAGAGFQTSVSSLTGGGQNTPVLLDAVKQWEMARNLGAFTASQRALFRDQSTHWHLSVVVPGKSWSLQRLDASGNPVGAAQSVVAPTPAFTTKGLPALAAGRLYETRVATNSPETVRYTITAGSLPPGLHLNPDTGGITGIPASSADTTFTVTAKGGPGVADAQGTFTTGTLVTAPEVTFSSSNSSVDRGGSLTMTASISNIGTTTMPGTAATISLPSGWTTSSATVNVGSIAAGATAEASWTVNVASNAAYGPQTSTVSVAYTGGPGNTTASLAIPVAYPHLTVVSADSQETVGENSPATNAVDGDPDTFWHTQWSGTVAPMPHEITLDLGSNKPVTCLYYLPRQDGPNGRIAKYEVYTSKDGTTWGDPVATGTWANTSTEQKACFTPVGAHYIRLRALSEVNGNPWTTAAEINVSLAED
ncbi:discoidin domain-containing protein [Streptomyces sp. NBC_01240]|uniref:discoidin domain-containing protein n=1 Tax=Streptomyces sp. NBC_01240 TaxID=2903793 RepID=UPI002E156D16|nr:discoidin domain-containing protein [Streptomyces sp. NBC_01240]